MYEQVLGGGLERNHDEFGDGLECFGIVTVGLRQHKRMVKLLDDSLFDAMFHVTKVNDHAVFLVVAVVYGNTLDGDEQFVGMAVDILALAVVAEQCVCHLK